MATCGRRLDCRNPVARASGRLEAARGEKLIVKTFCVILGEGFLIFMLGLLFSVRFSAKETQARKPIPGPDAFFFGEKLVLEESGNGEEWKRTILIPEKMVEDLSISTGHFKHEGAVFSTEDGETFYDGNWNIVGITTATTAGEERLYFRIGEESRPYLLKQLIPAEKISPSLDESDGEKFDRLQREVRDLKDEIILLRHTIQKMRKGVEKNEAEILL